MQLFDKIQETVAFIRERVQTEPGIGIILGSGLGGLQQLVEAPISIPYSEIPHFPVSTVKGHSGKLIFGTIAGQKVVLMAGRFHYYEGYAMQEVTFPVRVMKELGVHTLFVSNASGGVNPVFSVGDLMVIKDHINLFPEHPLRGANDERLGVRFPDMSRAYDRELISLAESAATELGFTLRHGVYAGLQGPSFETPAEYRWLKTIGGDAVGMSTVPEVIVARHAGIRVFAVSFIANSGINPQPLTVSHEEVLEAADLAAPKMEALVVAMLARMGG